MPSAHEIALDVLGPFGTNVVARRAWTYGQYATAIGRNSAKYGHAIGKAMHAIGALCVVRQIPVAPLFWVRMTAGEARGIFEADELERRYILHTNDYGTMYVVARDYRYRPEEFVGLEAALRKSLAAGHISDWSPDAIWHMTFVKRPKDSPFTYYERAMHRYRELFEEIKSQRAKKDM